MSLKIISGGQTGVDRAALDAALDGRIEVGGSCPKGREASDGVIPDKYPLQEIQGGYLQRTRKNIKDSDATVIIYFGFLQGGTEQTILFCIKQRKPYLLIDATEVSDIRAAERVDEFIIAGNVSVLNVAGPSADREPLAYDFTYQVIKRVLSQESA